ncbi:MAG: thiamine diphosphokinase [Clostridiales bacterium]|uniref:thiamine diphosphokinase n=1 Tax=Clostridium sp. N3C TaxID=1776758 RepID=UPI00092DF316|nr:thiamine diphosphokinase [Clostridium sp. N3C]NLZ49818.1 thiamine diphosphokinase [Clostridiales bacterium]SCN22011.1 Thiamine pyrophosphokinase [Clostridium sp. N3C]
MKALLVAGGNAPSKALLLDEAKNADYIVAIDKGMECLYENKIKPNIIVGDFDSINPILLKDIQDKVTEVLRVPEEKDFTDSQLALKKALELNVKEIVFLGSTGSRIDHTLANVGLLYQCLKAGVKAAIKDDNNTLFMVDKSTTLEANKDVYFSLISYGGTVEGLSIKNGKYALNGYNLLPYDNITISNEFIGKDVEITFNKGILLIAYTKD